MRPLLLLSSLLLFSGSPVAQSYAFPEPETRLYVVSARLIGALQRGEISLEALPDLGSALPAGSRRDTLPPGHYVQVRIEGEAANVSTFQTYRHQVYVGTHRGKFQLRVLDTEGRTRTDATVLADDRPVAYDARYAAYRRRDWRIDRLTVIIDQDTLHYGVKESIDGSRLAQDLRRLTDNRPAYYLLTPYRLVRNSYRYLKRGIGKGNWRWYRYPLQGPIRRLLHPPRPISGYVSTNQPRYRPGDTLRIAAYLARPGGRPLTADSIDLQITQQNLRGPVLRRRIGRNGAGRYVLDPPIPEDWTLDKNYFVAFDRSGPFRRDIAPRIQFRIEDYELDEYKLTTQASTDARLPGSAWVDVRASDVNGLSLPEGTVDVALLLVSVGPSLDSTLLVLPDTLYTHRESTDERYERRIPLPDSLFPTGYTLSTEIVTRLTTPSGEYQEDRQRLTVDRRYASLPQLSLREGWLVAALDGADSTGTATLRAITPNLDTTLTTIDLPHRRPIDHQLKSYVLNHQGQSAQVFLSSLRPTDDDPLSWQGDTLHLRFPNPHDQPLRYTLFKDGQPLPDNHPLRFPPGSEIRLDYRYLAGGRWQRRMATTVAPDIRLQTADAQLLDLILDQPERILPGQTVRLSVTATDQRGRPAPNVRLTAGSYNARFDKLPTTTPTYESKQRRERAHQSYAPVPFRPKGTFVPSRWMIHRAGLDTALAYRLRYPDPAFTDVRSLDHLMPTGQTGGHLAPFVIRDHQPEPIRMVFADDRLVYWYHPNITTPYSIPLDSGRHRIVLRTRGERFSRDVDIRPRSQHVLSFDADRPAAAGWNFQPVEEPTKNELTAVHNRVFALSHSRDGRDHLFRARPGAILQTGKVDGRHGWSPLGLATADDRITYWTGRPDSLRLRFEPRATYRIGPERDRLYPLALQTIENFQRQSVLQSPAAPGFPQYRVRADTSYRVRRSGWERPLPRLVPGEDRSRLQLVDVPADRLLQLLIVPAERETYYRLPSRGLHQIKPGTYDLLYHFRGDSVLHQRLVLGRDSLTYLPFRASELDRLVPFDPLRGFSTVRPPREEAEITYIDYDFFGDQLSGVVTDRDGEPLIGASILIVGTTQGTVTDLEGRFRLEVPTAAFELSISYVGFTPRQISLPAGGGSPGEMTVRLEENVLRLEEVVVMGYGITTKRDVTYTLSGAVTGLDVRNLPTRNVNQIATIAAGATSSEEGSALSIRGSRANGTDYYVDGVRVSVAEGTADLPPVQLRESFADYAAFLPNLSTDPEGRAVFDVTFPDDITAWNTYVVGQDRRRRVGFTAERTTAFLPVQAQLYLPRFLVEGDQSQALTLAINRDAGERPVRLTFTDATGTATEQDTLLGAAVNGRFPIYAPDGSDSLQYRFTLQSLDGEPAADGEARSLPVFPRGTPMVSGELLLLTDDRHTLPDSFLRTERGPVTLYLPGNRLGQLLNEVDYLVNYPYACAEQTASRLIGLLARRAVREASGQPDAQSPKIRRTIARLEKLRRADGGFGWWPGSPSSTPWISLHAYRALSAAERAGYSVASLEGTRRYLRSVAPELRAGDQLQIALTLAEEGRVPTEEEMVRLDTFRKPTDYELLAISRLRQLRGDTIDTERLLDSSSRHAVLGRYWGQRRFHFYRQPVHDRLAASLLARRIFSTAGRADIATEIVNYLLGQSTAGDRCGTRPLLSTNTLEGAVLVAELLPYLLETEGRLAPPRVRLSTASREETITQFPFEMTVDPREFPTLRLTRSGSGPLPLTVYQRWFEREPTTGDRGFTLRSRMVDARQREIGALVSGETAWLEVTVDVAADAEYVLVEAPIPAGCSYQQREEPSGPFAVHREYRRDRVAIFCDRLPAGTHTYRIALAPRFSGRYTLNPGRAEMQYLPVINGNDGLKTIRIQ